MRPRGEIAEQDVVALSRCDHLLGLSERANGNIDDAVKRQFEAVDRLLNLKIASPETPRDQLYLLATYYGEFADALAETGDREGASYREQRRHQSPHRPRRSFGKHAGTTTNYLGDSTLRLRSSGTLAKGRKPGPRRRRGISILRDILQVYPKRHDFSLELALQLGDIMDL